MESYSHIISATGGRFRSAGFAAAAKPSPCASYSELLFRDANFAAAVKPSPCAQERLFLRVQKKIFRFSELVLK